MLDRVDRARIMRGFARNGDRSLKIWTAKACGCFVYCGYCLWLVFGEVVVVKLSGFAVVTDSGTGEQEIEANEVLIR